MIMRARRTDAPRKTAITMAVMAPGPSTPEHTKWGGVGEGGGGVWERGVGVKNPTMEISQVN